MATRKHNPILLNTPRPIVTPPPKPIDPCYCCGSHDYWLLPDGSVWRCAWCHPPVGTKRPRVGDIREGTVAA